MFVNVTLCKTPINTTDTLFFANAEAQKAYFNGIQEKHTYSQSSFNGSRSFRIPVNYLEAVNTHYNYMYYSYAGRVWYCFIDNYTYVNDTSCEVNVTLDFVQTFMFDIKWKSSRVASFTWKQSHICDLKVSKTLTKIIPYSNKFPVFGHRYELVKSLINECRVGDRACKQGYLAITIDEQGFKEASAYDIYVKLEKYDGQSYSYDVKLMINSDGGINNRYYPTVRNGYEIPAVCFMFPIYYNGFEWKCYATDINFEANEIDGTLWTDDAKSTLDGNDIGHIIGVFMSQFSAFILDASIIPSIISEGSSGIIEWNQFTAPFTKLTHTMHETGLAPMLVCDKNGKKVIAKGFISSLVYYDENFKCISNTKLAPTYTDNIDLKSNPLYRNPFYSYYIGNGIDNVEIELSDIGKNKLTIELTQDTFMPYNTMLKIDGMWDEMYTSTFSLTQSVPYSVSAWAEYYAQAKVSVNDGLKTKHGYEREIAKNNMINTTAQGAVGIGVGAIGSAIGVAKGSSQALVGGIAQIASGASQIADSQVQYQNTLTNLEKERALLQIQWGDIKSAPSNFYSLGNDTGALAETDNSYISVYLKEPINLEQIQKYYKMYGYQTEEVIEADELKQQHTVFDYIRFEDANFITNLPHNTHQIIKQIFESGIRFWYDEENFLNFDIDNPEYQGV